MASEKKKRVASAVVSEEAQTPTPANQVGRYRRLAWIVGIALFALLYWARLDRTVGMFMDDAWYALIGKALATGHGYTLINSPTPGILPLYPPVYPALLALIFKLAPAAAVCMHRADAQTVSFSHVVVTPRRVEFRYTRRSPCRATVGDSYAINLDLVTP